jgi:putative transposase
VCVSITACIENGRPIFRNSEIVATFADIFQDAVGRYKCIVPVYCFMPEHVHALIKGLNETADTWRAFSPFKKRTGFWLSRNSEAYWQKAFYDHILRRDEDFLNQVRYIVNNPVRRGLVENWQDYPFTGSIGLDLKELLSDIQTA